MKVHSFSFSSILMTTGITSATATDVAGNTTRATDLLFTIDTNPPLVPLFDVTALKSTNLGPGIKAVTLQGTTSPDSEVRLLVNDVTYLTTADDRGEFQYKDIEVELDEDLLKLLAIDKAGNQTSFRDTIPSEDNQGRGELEPGVK